MFGPWDPPPRRPGFEQLGDPEGAGVPHTYTSPGTYTARFSATSTVTFCGFAGPYSSNGERTVNVTVDPASPTTTTSSTTTTTR